MAYVGNSEKALRPKPGVGGKGGRKWDKKCRERPDLIDNNLKAEVWFQLGVMGNMGGL